MEKDQNVPDKRVQVKKSQHGDPTAEENEPVVKDNVQHVVDEKSRDKQKLPQQAIQVCDEKNEDSTSEAICQQFPTAKEHTDKSVVNDILSDKDNEPQKETAEESFANEHDGPSDKQKNMGITSMYGRANEPSASEKPQKETSGDSSANEQSDKTQNAKKNMRDGVADKPSTKDKTEVCKDVSDDTISPSQEGDFAQLIKIIDEDNDKLNIVNESCESKSTSLEMDKLDGSCDTYYEMEEGPAVQTNKITESSSEEPEINGVHSSYNVDSNHLNHLKSNQDLQPFAHSLKIIKRKADSNSREIRKNDGKALFCKFAPCALANLQLLLTTLQIYFCPVQLIQKLGQISLGNKFVMKILELLNNEQELNELMKEENEDWEELKKEVNEDWEQPMTELLAKLNKTAVMPCTNVLIALQRKRFLTSFVKKEFGVYRKQYFLNTAINEFKMSQHKAGLMIYITAEKSHCVVLIKDENGEEVNIYDATINEEEVENLGNIRSLQILVLTYTNDKIPLIQKEWFKCKEFFRANNYDEAHKSNISAN